MGKHNRSLVVAGLVAAAVGGTASAGGGDNGMNPFYGDSWAALQGGGVNLGGETSMPGANVAHADPHLPWHVSDSAQHAESPFAAAMQRAEAAASENAARMRATLAAHAAPPPAPAVHQVDPFEDKAGS